MKRQLQLAGRRRRDAPDQFGPSRGRETLRFIRGTPLEMAAYSRLVTARATTTSADSCPLPDRVATDGAADALARAAARRTGLPG